MVEFALFVSRGQSGWILETILAVAIRGMKGQTLDDTKQLSR